MAYAMDSSAATLCKVDSLLGTYWAFEGVVGAVGLPEVYDFLSKIYENMNPLIITTEAKERFHELFSRHEALKPLLNIEEPKHKIVPEDLDKHRQQLILLRNLLATDHRNQSCPEDPTLTINKGNYYISQAADKSPAFADVNGTVWGLSTRAKKQDEAAACKQLQLVGQVCLEGAVPLKRGQKPSKGQMSGKKSGFWGRQLPRFKRYA